MTTQHRGVGARRRLAPRRLAACLLAATAAIACGRAPAEPVRPNLLLVTFDTTRADRLSAYGYEHSETPAVSRIARAGIRYARCYSPVPLTLPSHASVMTGLYPFHHGVRDNGSDGLGIGLPVLAEVLREHGYSTAAVVGAFVLDSRYGLDRGFDHYDDDFSGAEAPPKFGFVERRAEAVTDAALAWLGGATPGPFFLWVHYFDPHMPHAPPGLEPMAAIAAPYDLEIAYADRELERLLGRVDEIEQRTGRPMLLVFTADHGEALWEHGEPTHGFFVYEETLRVPLIVKLPSGAGGTVIEAPVSLVDVFPSILAWLGLPLPEPLDGAPLPTTQPEDARRRELKRALYFESHVPQRYYGWSRLRGVVVGDEKFIEAPRPELYDLRADPDEARNLFAEAGPRGEELRRILHDLTAEEDAVVRMPALPIELASDDARRLRSLGYLGASPMGSDTRGSGADPKDRVQLHRQVLDAQTAIDAGDPGSALQALAGTLNSDPNNRRVLFLLLDLLNDSEVREPVAELLERRMAERLPSPFDLSVPRAVGTAWSVEQSWARAEAALEIALEAAPEDAAANHLLARVLLARKRPPEAALPYAERAHRAAASDPRYASTLAQLLGSLGRNARAHALYEIVLAEDPDDALALNNSAWLSYEASDQLDRALSRSKRAVVLEPEQPDFHHTYGCLLDRAGRVEDAERELRLAGSASCPHREPPG